METKIRVLIVDFNSEFCRLLSEQMRESEKPGMKQKTESNVPVR